jgi:Skp family chaperone for outer membrane proteins
LARTPFNFKEQYKEVMKANRLIVAAAFIAAAVFPAFAQTKPATQPNTAPTSATLPDSKIAMIYSEEFQDAKSGIARFLALANTLNREFQPRQTEITQLNQKVTQLTDDIEKTKNVADPKTIQQKMDQLEQYKKELQRKSEDAQTAYTKRQQEIFEPLQADIGKALEAYAKAHGITVIIDGSRVPVVYAADSIDITRAFINEFNSKFPATASALPR